MTANGCASDPVPAVVGTATIGLAGTSVGPSYSSSQGGRSLAEHKAIAFAASIAEPPPSATTTVPSRPKLWSVVEPNSTVAPDGFDSTSPNIMLGTAAAASTSTARPATPASISPGSVTRNARDQPPVATSSGSRASAPTPNNTRLRRVISIWRSASPVTRGSR